MPTRSGKRYLISHKCHACDMDYYSHKNFNYKCSGCWEYCEKNGIMTSTEFGNKCRQWAKDNTVYAIICTTNAINLPVWINIPAALSGSDEIDAVISPFFWFTKNCQFTLTSPWITFLRREAATSREA